MNDSIPKGPWQRGVTGTRAAAGMGGRMVQYLVKKPFLEQNKRQKAREQLNRENAHALFQALCLLRGTALKIAQMLSMELDLLPEPIRKELEKSYNRVPPLNRALVRKAVVNSLGTPPERLFKTFELKAFAGASLGQVHRAWDTQGNPLAVKIKYPGIRDTIRSDIDLVKGLVRVMPDQDIMVPALAEIELRLMEETDYGREARYMSFFRQNLKLSQVHIPSPSKDFCCENILSADFIKGPDLNQWLKSAPSQKDRDRVAKTINDIFLKGFYGLNCIHADPHPGNFIIGADLSVGLVDFGCVKEFDPLFADRYQRLIKALILGDRDQYFKIVQDLDFIRPGLPQGVKEKIFQTAMGFGQWLRQIFEPERFDFSGNRAFMEQGRDLVHQMLRHRKHMSMNPDFIFLDRTRYGLFRLFEKMEARVRMKNVYEWNE